MALSALNTGAAANKGKAIELIHPKTQVPIGVRFYVLGTDSKEYQRVTRKQQAEQNEKQKRNRRGVYLKTPEEREADAVEILVTLTTGWEEDVTNDEGKVTGVRPEIELNPGELVPFSKDAVEAIYKDLGYSWIREQIDAESADRADFLQS